MFIKLIISKHSRKQQQWIYIDLNGLLKISFITYFLNFWFISWFLPMTKPPNPWRSVYRKMASSTMELPSRSRYTMSCAPPRLYDVGTFFLTKPPNQGFSRSCRLSFCSQVRRMLLTISGLVQPRHGGACAGLTCPTMTALREISRFYHKESWMATRLFCRSTRHSWLGIWYLANLHRRSSSKLSSRIGA